MLGIHSAIAVAAATLAAAALFHPVRRRVQHGVDRRFNRARYDADKTVAAYAVDPDAVRADLAGVVLRPWSPPTCQCGSASPTDDGGLNSATKPR